MRPLDRIAAYSDNTDQRAASCNLIALVVAWNQPLYPLYLLWFVRGDAWTACWTFLSTPFFAAVPWVARRNSALGRAMLPAVGIANTAISAKAFGTPSGVELFLLPCLLIAVLALRLREWRFVLALIGFALAVLACHGHYGASLGAYTADQYARFYRLNAWSVVTLSLFVAWRLGAAIRAEARASSQPNSRPTPQSR